METSSIVQLTGDNEGSTCGYCHSKEDTSFSTGLWAYHLHPQTYQTLIDGGWRRSGKYLYKPDIAKTCCPAYTIRLDSQAFVLSSGNKKAAKKVRRLLAAKVSQNNSEAINVADMRDVDNDDELEDAGPAIVDAGLAHLEKHAQTHSLNSKLESSHSIASIKMDEPVPESQPTPLSSTTDKKEKTPWVKQPKQKKNAPQNDVLALILDIESTQTAAGNKWEVKLVPAAFEEDTFQLYYKYQTIIHKDPPSKIKKSGFTNFLVDSPLTFIPPTEVLASLKLNPSKSSESKSLGAFPGYGSFHQKYYLNDVLIAVSVLDILPSCVSAVYFMYDPSSPTVRSLSMGVYSALRECALTKQYSQLIPSLKYYYMGFYIHSCSKMRYKAQFKPSDLVCPKTYSWVPVDKCVRLLDVHKVAVLSAALTLPEDVLPDSSDASIYGPSAISFNYPVDIRELSNVMIYDPKGIILLRMLPQGVGQKVLRELILFTKLVGIEVVKKLIFVIS